MKKFIKFLLLATMVSLLLAGCKMKMEVGVKIDEDSNVEMTVVSAMDNEFIDTALSMNSSSEEGDETSSDEAKVFTDEERWAYIEEQDSGDEEQYKGFEKARYEEGDYKGTKYTKKLGKIDAVIAENENELTVDDISKENSKIFTKNGDLYVLHLSQDLSGDSMEQTQQLSQYGVEMLVNFTLTLPQPAESSNATSVSEDGLTYTWDLLSSSSIDATFKLPTKAATPEKSTTPGTETAEKSNLPLIIGIICGVVVVAIIAFVLLKKKAN